MAKEKLREEISDEFKWDLTPIYKDEKIWQQDFERASIEVEKIINYKDTFLHSAKQLLEYFDYDQNIERLILKLYYYAHLNFDSDTTNDRYKEMYNKIRDLYNRYEELSSFVVPCILKLDYSVFEKFYKEETKLLEYKFVIDEIYRFKEHTLDEDKEKILSNLNKCLSNPEDTFEILTDTDMKFGTILDENNEEHEFNESNYTTFIRSSDRRVRKDAFELLFNTYSNFKNTIASTLSGEMDYRIVTSKIRNYDNALIASLYSDNVDINIYNNLIEVINNNMDIMYKYYDLKKKVLNLDEFHMYDVYVPLIEEYNENYSFDKAKELVINALSVLGDDYITNLKKAFDEKWIDIYHNKGKRSGAYSSGFYDTKPYLLLNYEGKLNDVSTLAHELGHSMHTYYSCKNNLYQYSHYKIFVAEVASTVNELLLANYLLKNSKDKNEKLAILNHLMDLFKGTLFRQTMFAEFEKGICEKRENKEVLTATKLSDYYYNLVKKYFGDNVVVDDLIRYEWERIPHFYYNFYVYKYATSLSASCYIATGILDGNQEILNNYLKFLTLGGSMYPIDELKVAGVDMNNKEVIESAVKMFNNLIDEFDDLYSSEV